MVNELLLLKARARTEKGQMAVFFIDDNFAINVKRTKSLLLKVVTGFKSAYRRLGEQCVADSRAAELAGDAVTSALTRGERRMKWKPPI